MLAVAVPPVDAGLAHNKITEHLSNERTYLAWLRTSISMISLGIAINKFSLSLFQANALPTQRPPRWVSDAEQIGYGLVIFGILVMIWAAIRYEKVSREIEARDFRPSRFAVWTVTAGVLVLGLVGLIWMFRR